MSRQLAELCVVDAALPGGDVGDMIDLPDHGELNRVHSVTWVFYERGLKHVYVVLR